MMDEFWHFHMVSTVLYSYIPPLHSRAHLPPSPLLTPNSSSSTFMLCMCTCTHTHTCIHIQLNEDSIHEKKYIHLYFPLLFLPHFSFFSFSKCCLFSFDVCMSIYMYTLIRLYGWKKTCDIEKSEYSIQKIRYELECLSIQIKPYAYIKL